MATKIERIELSVFETESNTGRFDLVEVEVKPGRIRWKRQGRGQPRDEIHVLHVITSDGIQGDCTVGDARYTTMRRDDLEQLRILAIGEDALDRERLIRKMHAATRGMFTLQGWYGTFDNCLWDIAGKLEGKGVRELLGQARASCPAYYNLGGATKEAAAEDACVAVERGFPAVKDHFGGDAAENIDWFRGVRAAVGDKVDVLHDAAGCDYTLEEAITVGKELDELHFGWFEEPLPDRDQEGLQELCATVEVPILAPETMMNDFELSALWLRLGAVDMLRVNARAGMTHIRQLAQIAEEMDTTIEANGPGGLFGLIHAHLVCGIGNTTYYEYFPDGSRDAAGQLIGLLNPPVPVSGQITTPAGPGWGAEWDWTRFKRARVALL
ncbi:MAG: enolase C-terminal domain-like protein [Candidatus Latescibacterota bacterium]|nr:enolase C-terminal domain-like protein [Candidatus Latescibacterota bacterium]